MSKDEFENSDALYHANVNRTKIFTQYQNDKSDPQSKACFKQFLEQRQHTNIVLRENEIANIKNEFFWDVSSINSDGKKIYWDVEHKKSIWECGHVIPSLIADKGFHFLDRKSKDRNEKQSYIDYIAMFSSDFIGLFIISKSTFEKQSIFRKNTKFVNDERYRAVRREEGTLFLKIDGIWVQR